MKILGLNITRGHERKASETWAAVMAYMTGQQAVYTPRDYGPLVKAGYQTCATIYAAVSLIARAASGIRWTVSRKASDGTLAELETHPLLDLLSHPNEYDSGYRFVESVVSYKLLAGNSYIEKVHGLKSAPPRFLYPLRPDRMKVKPGNAEELVAGYVYEANGQKRQLDKANILHMKDFHPLHDFYGLSRLEVAATSVDISNWSQEWNLKLLQNDMRPPGMLLLQGLSETQSEKIRSQFQGRYAGAENAGKALVIENATDAKWEPLAITPRDADWIEADKKNLRRICSVFNIASELLGDSENKTYSNMQEARKALYQEAVLPEMDALTDAFQGWLAPLYGDGIVIGYDRDSIEALQEEREKKYTYLAGANWLTVNEKRVACGYDEIPDGDVVLVGMGEMSLSDAVAPPGAVSGGGGGDEDEGKSGFKHLQTKSLGSFWRGENERKALWRNYERRVTRKERAFAREAKAYLAAQGAAVAARAATGVTDPDALLDRDEAEKSYKAKFMARYRRLYATALAAGRAMADGKLYEFDDGDEKADGGWVDEATRRRLEKLIEESAKVITDETLAEIQAVMRDSLGTNLTVQEIANALKDKLVDQMPDVRARRIARTETGMLENAGNLDGFRENENVDRKGWLCSFVEESRDAHMEADGQEVGIDEDFIVGGERLAYPGDRRGGASAGNVVNCLCAVYPIVS
jgi:HK97 family phage portal protein